MKQVREKLKEPEARWLVSQARGEAKKWFVRSREYMKLGMKWLEKERA
ncbi:MAG: hypothetical protein ACXQS5_02555 [Candidatus Methanospirareceae archaeon]